VIRGRSGKSLEEVVKADCEAIFGRREYFRVTQLRSRPWIAREPRAPIRVSFLAAMGRKALAEL
jgi:hypothetical protein